MAENSINKSIQDILAEIDKRLEDRIIEPTNATLLKKLISNADSLTEALDIAELGTTYKRTGFHYDKRLEKMSDTIKYFRKNQDLSFKTDDDAITHKLIVGDNYDALLNLLIEYRGRIDVIYLDPPYGKDSMGEFAKTNYENAITRDNLLSMLYPRLVLAKQLLSDSGVIFCSIDDKNQAYIKCLFDEIFEEKNFVASAPRKTGAGSAATRSQSELRKMNDILLIYKSSKNTIFKRKEVGEKEYKYEDEYGKFMLGQFQASGSDATRTARPNMYYSIYQLDNNELTTVEPRKSVKVYLPKKVKEQDGRWLWNKDKFEKDSAKFIYFDGKTISRKIYYDESKDQTLYQVERAWFEESIYQNSRGTTELDNILIQKGRFNNPKPVELIKWCINLIPNNDICVLDFFAGSGTTGQAVLELNKQDGGSRQYIMATSNEVTETTPNGVVSDVTSKRLKRVMTGKCYDGTDNFKWLEKNNPLGGNLDVYDIKTVANFEATKDKTPFDVIDETLYGQPTLDTKDKVKWVCENFEGAQNTIENDSEYKTRIGGEE